MDSWKASKEIKISTKYMMDRLYKKFDAIKLFVESIQMHHKSNKELILMKLEIVLKCGLLVTTLVEPQMTVITRWI